MNNTIKKLSIEPGCTTCGLCEFIAPAIFEVTDVSHIKKDGDPSQHADAVKQAAAGCPVQVIKYE